MFIFKFLIKIKNFRLYLKEFIIQKVYLKKYLEINNNFLTILILINFTKNSFLIYKL